MSKKTTKKVTKKVAKKAVRKVAKKITKKAAKPVKKKELKASNERSKKTAKNKIIDYTPNHSEIQRIAYFIYLERLETSKPGNELTDWQQALESLTNS